MSEFHKDNDFGRLKSPWSHGKYRQLYTKRKIFLERSTHAQTNEVQEKIRRIEVKVLTPKNALPHHMNCTYTVDWEVQKIISSGSTHRPREVRHFA
jgi:hypothetical protein